MAYALSTPSNVAAKRMGWMQFICMLFFALFLFRAFDLSVLQSENALSLEALEYARAFSESHQDTPKRGKIYDREGVLMAASLPAVSVSADPRLVYDPRQTAIDIAKILPDRDVKTLYQKLSNPDRRFVWVKRHIHPRQQGELLRLGQPGLKFEQEYQRIYPHGSLGGALLGYTDIDAQGMGGIERGLNETLAGGEHVNLTIDHRLQFILREEIIRTMNDFTAQAGTGVIMDVHSGEILAGVSLPDLNPHNRKNAQQNQLFNRLSLGVYEMGSIFKIFSTAAFLEFENAKMDHSFDVREPLKVGRHTIRDFHPEERILSLPEVFMKSSNIGSALMGQDIGTEKLRDFYADLGLTDPLSFEVKEVGKPLVPSPWREINTLTATYGHGLATTPLQMIAAVSSVVNGGFLVRPSLIQKPEPAQKIQIISPETSQKMNALLRLTVDAGTGAKGNVPGYQVGGKTGTAEKVGANGRYDSDKLLSSFVGVFPARNPQYAVLILIDEPKPNEHSYGYATGGWVAAPAVAKTIKRMASVLGISPYDGADDIAKPLMQFVAAEEGR